MCFIDNIGFMHKYSATLFLHESFILSYTQCLMRGIFLALCFRVQPFWSQDPWPKRADDEQQHQLRLRVPEDQSEEITIRQVLDKYLQYSTRNWKTAYKVTMNTMNWLFLLFFSCNIINSPSQWCPFSDDMCTGARAGQ